MPFDVEEGEGMGKAQEVQGTGIKNRRPRITWAAEEETFEDPGGKKGMKITSRSLRDRH